MDHEPDQRDSSTPTEPGGPTDPAAAVEPVEVVGVVEEPLPLTEAGLARLMLSQSCAELAEFAASMISPSADKHAGSGELAENGRRMVTLAEQALTRAVVYERVRGTNWATIGEQLGGITKQSASARFGTAASTWTAP